MRPPRAQHTLEPHHRGHERVHELHALRPWERFSGTITDCGSGSFFTHALAERTLLEFATTQDPKSGQVQAGDASWRYIDGTGTGAFVRLRSLDLTVRHIQFNLGTFENHEQVDEGTVT